VAENVRKSRKKKFKRSLERKPHQAVLVFSWLRGDKIKNERNTNRFARQLETVLHAFELSTVGLSRLVQLSAFAVGTGTFTCPRSKTAFK